MTTTWRTSVAWLLLSALLAGCSGGAPKFKNTDITGAGYGKALSLTDQSGKHRTLADFRGKVVLLFFGYTHCPDVCPTTMANLSRTLRLLGKDAERVQVIFITVDPERDTREVLAKFVPAFDRSFLGLYGDAKATASAAKSFRADYRKVPAKKGYYMDHTALTYVIDTQGKLRLLAGDREPDDWLAQDVRLLLASTG